MSAVVPPTTQAMSVRAFELIDEILENLSRYTPFVLSDEDEKHRQAAVRASFERIVQQVCPLVAGTTVMEMLASFTDLHVELVAEVATAVEGMVPEVSPCGETQGSHVDPCGCEQLTLPDELIPKPKAEA